MGYQNFFATRLFTDIGAADTTITLENPPTPTEGYLVLEARNTSKREIISYTGVSGNDITGVARGVGGTSATDHTKNSLVEMNVVAEDLEAALAVPDDIITRFDEVVSDHVASGLVWTDDTGLTADLSAGVAYINGIRLVIAAVPNHTFTASKDTYVDLGDNGVLDYNEVSNNATPPALAASHLRLARVVTDGSNTTSIYLYSNGSSLAVDDGWKYGFLPTVNSVTNNGKRSTDVTFASSVASILYPGMRVMGIRSIMAPKQCADLESSSSHYFRKTSPTGISFTTTWFAMAWIKLESYQTAATIIARRNASVSGFGFRINQDGAVEGYSGTGSAFDICTSYEAVPANKWVHVAMGFDIATGTAGACPIYIDGQLVPGFYTASAAASITQSGDLCIGYSGTSTEYFDGKISQVGLFSAVITASTLRSYMNQPLVGDEASCVGAWTLNNTLNDSNANANHLTAMNSAVATDTDAPYTKLFDNTIDGFKEMGIVTKVSGSVATIQFPEGSCFPTSGGIRVVAHSNQKAPAGMILSTFRWVLESLSLRQETAKTNTTYAQFYGEQMIVPVGAWTLKTRITMYTATSATSITADFALSTSTTAVSFLAEEMTKRINNDTALQVRENSPMEVGVETSAMTTYYLIGRTSNAAGSYGIDNDDQGSSYRAYLDYL